MFFSHFGNENFSLQYQELEFSMENEMEWRLELAIANVINITVKSKITTLKKLIEIRQMTLNVHEFHINK